MDISAVIGVVLIILYIVVRTMKPTVSRLSAFEIERRAKIGDETAVHAREQARVAPIVSSLRWFISIILVIGITTALTFAIGPGSAVVVSILIVLAVAWLENWKPLVKFGARLYAKAEPRLNKLYGARKYLVFLPVKKVAPVAAIDSEAELLHLLDHATFLESDRRALIHSALEFTGLSVSDAMSGRRSIRSVDKGEVLGPLMLDELYKTGKQAFVVTDGGLDTVVGILKLERLTNLDLQDSPPAVNAMSPEVHYIDEDAPITDALSYLRSSKAPFLVVQDTESHTVGLLTMDNILRCLFES